MSTPDGQGGDGGSDGCSSDLIADTCRATTCESFPDDLGWFWRFFLYVNGHTDRSTYRNARMHLKTRSFQVVILSELSIGLAEMNLHLFSYWKGPSQRWWWQRWLGWWWQRRQWWLWRKIVVVVVVVAVVAVIMVLVVVNGGGGGCCCWISDV